jgi:RNA polymerase sigma factor (TIGR02999 family)
LDSDGRSTTVLLRAWQDGDRAALDELLPRVYNELHRLARSKLRRERPEHTLGPTALVSEAFLRLVGGESSSWNDRVHFFAVASRHMRSILVDHARRRSAAKRGGPERAVPLDEELVGSEQPGDLVALHDALTAFEQIDERKARVVEMHYFGGMEQHEIAAALGVHVNTVARDLRFAEAWLNRYLRDG